MKARIGAGRVVVFTCSRWETVGLAGHALLGLVKGLISLCRLP